MFLASGVRNIADGVWVIDWVPTSFDLLQLGFLGYFCRRNVSPATHSSLPVRLVAHAHLQLSPLCSALQARFPADPANPEGTNVSASYAFVIMTWIFNFAFSLGIGPISWAVPPAIFTTGIRSKGTALSSMSAWVASEFRFVVTD